MSEQQQKVMEYQVICPNHGRSKIFTNKFYAQQELARHLIETTRIGQQARLVSGERA